MANGQNSLSPITDRFAKALNGQLKSAPTWNPQAFDILAILKKRWWMVYTSILLGWILAGLYFLTADSVYQSNSQLLVMRKEPKLASQNAGSRDANSISEDLLATQMQVLQSRRIVTQALNISGLDQLESIQSELESNEIPTDYVIDRLEVTRGGAGQARDAHVLNISFKHSSSEESKQVLEALLTHYQDFLNEKFQDVNREAANLITEARSDLSQELVSAEKSYQDYREQAPLLWNGDVSTNIHRNRYDQLQAELSLLSIQVNEAEARMSVVKKVVEQQEIYGATDLERLVVIDQKNAERVGILLAVQQGKADTAEFQSRQPERLEIARSEYEGLFQLKMKEKELLRDFGPRHPAVENVREQIQVAQSFINDKSTMLGVEENESTMQPKDLQDAYVKLLERDLETLYQRRAELDVLASREEESAKTLVKYEIGGETLRQRATRQQELYDAVVDRLREINLTKDYGGIINEVIAEAELGEEIWPKLPICLAFGTLFGLVLGTGRATYAEISSQSFRSADDVKQTLGIPLLAHVPLFEIEGNSSLNSVIAASHSLVDPSIYAHHLPHSQSAEVFRGLRTSLFFRTSGTDNKTIGITSPNQGDGKSTLLLNLAISMAQSGRSVLIVDADLRRPRVGQLLGLKGGDGLAGILESDSEPWDAIQTTEIENLSALPCGTAPANPAELLSRPQLANFLSLVRDRYDYVLVDCPPVLAIADPCIVAPLVDATLLVLEASAENSRPDAMQAKEMLEQAGADLLGCCINRSEFGDKSGYGFYDYRQQHEQAAPTEQTVSL